MITDNEITAILARVDQTLRDFGRPVSTGACKCGRCERRTHYAASGVPTDKPAPAGLAGGQLVTKPVPAPRAPQPGGIAVRLPVAELIEF